MMPARARRTYSPFREGSQAYGIASPVAIGTCFTRIPRGRVSSLARRAGEPVHSSRVRRDALELRRCRPEAWRRLRHRRRPGPGPLVEERRRGSRSNGSAGLDLHAAVALGSFPVGFAAGAGYQFGASVPGGFAYEAGLLPVGLAVMVDKVGWVAVMAGGDLGRDHARALCTTVGRRGAPGAATPRAASPCGVRAPGVARGRRSQGRADGIDFADELDAGAGFRFGEERVKWGMDTSRGLFVGGLMRQWLGATGYGVALGYTVDVQFGG